MKNLNINSLYLSISGTKVIHNLSFETSKNCVRVRGGNGTGKTTLLLAIAGLLPIATGDVRLLGKTRPSERRGICGVFSSGISVPEYLTASQAVSLFNADGQETLAEFETQFFNEMDLGSRVGKLSEGQQRKVGLVCALRKERGALLLDEPFNALDAVSADLLRDYLYAYQGFLICVDHRNSAIGLKEDYLDL